MASSAAAAPPDAAPTTSVIRTDEAMQDVYDLGKKLGEGVAGKVYQATHKSSGAVVAVKTIACGWGPGAAAKVRHNMPRLVTLHTHTHTHTRGALAQ